MKSPERRPDAGRTVIVVRDADDVIQDREELAHPLTVTAVVSALARLRERHVQRKFTAGTASPAGSRARAPYRNPAPAPYRAGFSPAVPSPTGRSRERAKTTEAQSPAHKAVEPINNQQRS